MNFFCIWWLVANTLHFEMTQLHRQKDGFKENTRIGPVLEVTTSFQHFKFGIEIRIESVSQDNSHSLIITIFPRLFISWRKLQLFLFTHCPLASHCQQSPRILCPRCFVPWFLTTAFFSKFPSGSKVLISNVLLDISFHHSFQSVIIRS